MILFEFIYTGMVEDIKSFFIALFNIRTYIGIFSKFNSSVRDVYSKPVYHISFAMLLVLLSIANKLEWYWILLTIGLVLYTWFRKIWKTGDPEKFYKDRFFPEKYQKV